MAATPRAPRTKRSASKRAPPQGEPVASVGDRILDAALEEAAAVGWSVLTLAAVASRAGIGLGEVLIEIPTKAHLRARFIDRIDRLTLRPVTAPDHRDRPRDRLFEVMVRRFDGLNRHRLGARAIIAGAVRDPATIAMSLCRLDRSIAAMLGAADIATDGPLGFVRVKGLKVVYLAALRVWMNDDSEDMAKTMAALDRALRQGECLMNLLPFRRRSAEKAVGKSQANAV